MYRLALYRAKVLFSKTNKGATSPMAFNLVLGIWITTGLLLGFAMPPIFDGAAVLHTRQIGVFHIPMAVTMLIAFMVSASYGVRWLKTHEMRADALSVAFAEVGAWCGLIATITGAIWAKINWNAYWNWDPQQIGIVTTLLTYAALFALRGAVEDDDKRRNLWAVYAIIGLLVAVFSTIVYRRLMPPLQTLHPPNTLFRSNPVNSFILWFNVLGYILVAVRLATLRANVEILRERWRNLQWA
jgi:heme exporter protein C